MCVIACLGQESVPEEIIEDERRRFWIVIYSLYPNKDYIAVLIHAWNV